MSRALNMHTSKISDREGLLRAESHLRSLFRPGSTRVRRAFTIYTPTSRNLSRACLAVPKVQATVAYVVSAV